MNRQISLLALAGALAGMWWLEHQGMDAATRATILSFVMAGLGLSPSPFAAKTAPVADVAAAPVDTKAAP